MARLTGLSHLYTRHGFDRTRIFFHPDGFSFIGCPCYYCGELASTEDHAYPVVALRQIYGLTDLPSERLLVLVPACLECNVMLGDKVFYTMQDRKRYLKKRLRLRYKNLLALPAWHPQELIELEPGLRAYVERGLWQQENLKKRLSW